MLTLGDMASKPKAGGLTLGQMAATKPKKQAPAKATPRIAGGELVSGGPRRMDAFMSGFANTPLVKAVTNLFHPKDKIVMPKADPDYIGMAPQGASEWLPYIAGTITGETPTIAGAYATGGVAGAGALAGIGSKVPKLSNMAKAPLAQLAARGAGAGLVHGTGRAAVEGKPLPESLKNIGIETALFAIGDPAITKGAQVAGKAIGKGIQAYRGRLEAPALQGLDLTRPAQLKMLPSPAAQGALPPGSRGLLTGPNVVAGGGRVGPQKALPATGEEIIMRQYADELGVNWPLNTQGKATVQLHRALDDVRQSVQESTIPPMESKRQLVNFVHDGLGGDISKAEIRKLPLDELADMAQLIAGGRKDLWKEAARQAGKKGIDLDDLHRTATDPEYARWKDVAGLGGEKPPLIPKPYKPEAELAAARNILKKTKDINRAAKILETYPQLKPEFKGWVGRINKMQAKTAQQAAAANAPKTGQPPTGQPPIPPAGQPPIPPAGATADSFRAKVNREKPKRTRFADMIKEFQTQFVDDMNPLYRAEKSIRGEIPSAENSLYKQARLFRGVPNKAGEIVRTKLAPATSKGYTLEDNKAVAQAALEGQDVTKLKDIGSIKAQHFDLFRIVSEVFGGNLLKGKGTKAKEFILDPLDASKGAMTNFERQYAKELKQNVVSRGIRAGSKESALLQDFGEGVMSEANLKRLYPERYREMLTAERAAKQAAKTPEEKEAARNFRRNFLEEVPFTIDDLKRLRPNDWQKFVEAEQWFRQQYDTLRDSVNKVYEEIYAHAPDVLAEKLVPYRKDYFRHFRETGDSFSDVMAMMETPANINPALVGKSEIMRPRSRWLPFAQRRGDGEYTKDAVGGFVDYLKSSAYHIHVTPHIGRLKALGESLAAATGETKNLNNFIQILERHEQALAGKTHIFDRQIQEYIGRGPFRVVNWVNNRVRANSILGNIGTLVAQATHIPMAIAQGKQHAAPATVDLMRSLLGEMKGAAKGVRSTFDDPILKSSFMNERFKSSIYRQFERGFFRKGVNTAGAALEFCDRLASTFTWHTMYRKAVAQGLENPIKWADDWTRGITAGRGIGEVPYALQSQMSRLVIPFQIEVNNIILVHRELAKHDKIGLGMLAVASWLFNRFSEETRGSKLMPDPIMAIGDAAKTMMDEEKSVNERFKRAGYRLGGEVLTSIPGGQHIGAALVPDVNKRREYFGAADPTRYGTGLLARQAISDPVYKMLLPFGGGQVKKTVGGASALMDEGVYNKDGTKLSYPVNPDVGNAIKALIFGKYATREGREYFSEEKRPLSEKQTTEYKQKINAGMKPEKVYGDMQKQRRIEAVDKKIKEVMNSDMPTNDKANKIRELNKQKIKLMAQ